MTLRIALAAFHLIALGLGLGAVIQRGVALREPATAASLRRAFRADAMWGIAALLWLSTGLWRLLDGTEKPLGYYMQNHVFFGKMGLFLVILALEIMPAVTLARWRRALARGDAPETIAAPATTRRIATISHIEALLVVLIVFAAVSMARGLGAL
jgi:putative membrane protein